MKTEKTESTYLELAGAVAPLIDSYGFQNRAIAINFDFRMITPRQDNQPFNYDGRLV
jgi:hypothetical protein